MLRCLLLLVLNAAGFLAQNFQSSGTYLVLAPRIIRPNRSFDVAIQNNYNEEVEFNVIIQRNSIAVLEQDVILKPGPVVSTQKISFFVPPTFAQGSYKLLISASSGSNPMLYQNETLLEYVAKSKSVFIQTDKAIYKPGQKVHFRIIVTDPELKPISGDINTYINDAVGNRIKQWLNKTINGVFSDELVLSHQPILGDWSINGDFMGESFKKLFTVDEYVLPKFEVTIDCPSYVSYSDKEIEVLVKSKYTYGKPVKGLLEISSEPFIHLSNKMPVVKKNIEINGKAVIKFSMAELNSSKTSSSIGFAIFLQATVTEALTGIKQVASTKMFVYSNKIKISIIRGSETFKPNLKYTAYIKVAYQDDTLVPVTSDSSVTVLFSNFKNINSTSRLYPLPANGLIEVDYFPDESFEELVIKAQFEDVIKVDYIRKASSSSNSFIQIISQSHSLKKAFQAGSEGEFQVNCTEPLPYFSYVLLSKGSILAYGVVPMRNKTLQRFRLQMTVSLSPRGRLLVYYIRPDNEVLVDAIDFLVDGVMQNQVSISMDTLSGHDVSEPFSQVKVRVKAAPNSYVGLMAVDQSVLLLKTGNDITEKMVYDELESYDPTRNNQNPLPEMPIAFSGDRNRKKRMIWWVGGIDANQIFENSGVVILTNANVFHDSNAYPVGYFYGSTFGVKTNDVMTSSTKSDRARFYFPETWFWNDTQTGSNGVLEQILTVPDTITSWVASAISVDSKQGFGVAPINAKLRVFRPFFVSLNLPYSVIRGENILIQAVVFNYLNEDLQVDVSLQISDGFELLNNTNSNEITNSNNRNIKVASGNGESVSFSIIPKVLGNIEIQLQAKCSKAADTVLRKLLVKAEGIKQYFNHPIFVDPFHTGPISADVEIKKPMDGVVEGSEKVEVTSIGDIMGLTVNNLENLLRIPSGCGEQNMLKFVPNIVITEYLNVTNQLTDNIRAKALALMEIGYQGELIYKRKDNMFSAFGDAEESGSTWLTAFVVKSFYQAKDFISIDEKIIEDGLKVLKEKQNKDGSFSEVGKIFHTAMQGGASKGVPLTAYVVITLLENEISTMDPAIQLAIQYLEKQFNSINDAYSLAIISYALTLSNNEHSQAVLNKLESLAVKNGKTKYWHIRPKNYSYEFSTTSPSSNFSDELIPDPFTTSSVEIETASYVLLSYVLRKEINNGYPIVMWLASQQNSNGGFSSTQDTVIGLQALSKFMELAYTPDINLDISITAHDFSKQFTINRNNALVLQIAELPHTTNKVQITANGKGIGLVQLSWSYNVKNPVQSEAFHLETFVKNTADNLHVNACTSYSGDESTGMVVMELSLPSGFIAEKNKFSNLVENKQVQRLETRKDDTEVIAYFNGISIHPSCIEIPAQRVYSVTQLKEVPISVYQYYDTGKRITHFYKPERELTACDVCEDNCDPKCDSKQRIKYGGISRTSDSTKPLMAGLIILIFALTFLV